jgi:hypothetical protein
VRRTGADSDSVPENPLQGLEKVKLSLLDSNKVIDKNQDGIVVKTPPDLSKHFKLPKD